MGAALALRDDEHAPQCIAVTQTDLPNAFAADRSTAVAVAVIDAAAVRTCSS